MKEKGAGVKEGKDGGDEWRGEKKGRKDEEKERGRENEKERK